MNKDEAPEIIFISQSDPVNYAQYSRLPIGRIELFSELVFPRMVYFRGGFRSYVDVLNYFYDGCFYQDASYSQRREMLNIWDLPGFNSIHVPSVLKAAGVAVAAINNVDSEWDNLDALLSVAGEAPLVGLSTTFHLSFSEAQRVIQHVRQVRPDAAIVLGGAFINEQMINQGAASLEAVMRRYGIDYLLFGMNSENDLVELILCRRESRSVSGVPNLAYLDHNADPDKIFRVTALRWRDPVLETPFSVGKIGHLSSNGKTIQMRTSYGCPFACEFCSYPQTAGKFVMLDAETVECQVAAALTIYGARRVIFIDDTFNASLQRFVGICRRLASLNIEWFCFLRGNLINEESACLMREAGCRGVYLGIESANDDVLRNMNKRATARQFFDGVAALKNHGIITIGAFIIGFPGETDATIEDDVRFMETSGLDFYTLKEFYYMPHTPIHQKRERYGLTGTANRWSHATMDYLTAHRKKIEMFLKIKGSVFIDPDTNLWHLAYLYDQGFDFAQISAIQQQINAVVMNQIRGQMDDNHSGFRAIAAMLIEEAYERR